MQDYNFKVVKLKEEDNIILEEKLNLLASNNWELVKILDNYKRETLNLVLKQKKGINIKTYLENWESPFLKINNNNTYIFRAIIGAKYLRDSLLEFDQLSSINDITKTLNINYSRLPITIPKRWGEGLIFYNDIDLSKLIIDSETLIKKIYPKKYILTNKKGFIEYKSLNVLRDYQDVNIFKQEDLYNLIDIIKFARKLLEKKNYKSEIYIKIQLIANELYLPNIKRIGLNKYLSPLFEFPLEIEKNISQDENFNSLNCVKEISNKIWQAYGQKKCPVFEED